ncbi:MAG: twin-arginine translocase TatA/TatE family subunit [Armatimonadota bacterium]|nr:twin-arginine translocase TatA/TatE family subunit [Armatimonadota bacterium]MDR7535123.1 twin-arginine translocase TatA/TatE family subunit [Armatimonadota bacterium]
MPNVGAPELLVILVIALLLFGPQRLVGIGGALGKAVREFRQSVHELEEDVKGSGESRPDRPRS